MKMKAIRFVALGLGVVLAVLLSAATAHALSYAINYDGTYVYPYGPAPTFPITGSLGPDRAYQSNWNNIHSPMIVNQGGGWEF